MLTFRSWSEDDFYLATELWADRRVTAMIGARDPRKQLDEEIACERAHGFQYWPTFLDGAFIGAAGLHPREERVFEVGAHLLPQYWGRGLATEAVRAAIRRAFDEFGATAVFAGHNPGNAASRRILDKLGFTYTHDELYPPTGLMHPSYLLEG